MADDPRDPFELTARCASHARTLREIGEESMAADIEALISGYITELGGGPRG